MGRVGQSGGFWLSFLLNLLLNWQWSIPGWLLLGLHLWLQIPVWWALGGFALWILRILPGMWLMGWAARCSAEKDPPKENKNPYSKKST